jgi:hypothetical protein
MRRNGIDRVTPSKGSCGLNGMKTCFLDEPELEFGAGRHIDIRFGLANYGPLDVDSPLAPHEIRVGIVGTSETIAGVREWLERCAAGVPAKQSPQPYLFPAFPGFGTDTSFAAKLLFADRLERTIQEREVINLARHGQARLIEEAVELFLAEMRHLVENAQPHVIVCALPWSLLDLMAGGEDDSGENVLDEEETEADANAADEDDDAPDFHHLLKARAMRLRTPIQLVKPSTYGNVRRGRGDDQIQDGATRAWNFFAALYYKAGGTPWRLVRDPSALTTCYVGVAFYNSRDRESLSTSIAQVFNERGDGVIVRGAAATVSKEDRQPHLAEEDAYQLLVDALELYRREHKNLPARVASFKTSRHNAAELAGFQRAIADLGVDSVDLVSVGKSSVRLFRHGAYPPLRGTLLTLDEREQALYTRGSVEFFATYPGMYVPQPLALRLDAADTAAKDLAREALALTKMNWNNTQFDGHAPITIRAARQVGNILKYVGPDDPVEPRYASYM